MRWRVVDCGFSTAGMNMAVDESLMSLAYKNGPAVRFYKWAGKAYTIGYFQKVDDVAGLMGIEPDFARRITGGGLVKHGEDITYSITCLNPDLFFGCGPGGIYKKINEVIADSLTDLGLNVELAGREGSFLGRSKNCFAEKSRYDILTGQSKIAGSAQRRMGENFVQQGSIAADGVSLEIFTAKFVDIFSKVFSVKFSYNGLTAEEQNRAVELCDKKYSTKEWNYRK